MSVSTPLASEYSSDQRFTLGQLLFFHLVPGVIITLVYAALAWLTMLLGWAPSLALLLTWLILCAIVILRAVLNIAVPIIEELYFRSFLLPRFPISPCWAPLWSTILFSLYHFWAPWDIIGRMIALLPVVYVMST